MLNKLFAGNKSSASIALVLFFISLLKAIGIFLVAFIGVLVAIEGVDLLRTEYFIRRLDRRMRL